MLQTQERKPFEILDTNKRHGFKRLQPSRAAKTSHKWLSTRNDFMHNGSLHRGFSDMPSISNLGCNHLHKEIVDKENFGENILTRNTSTRGRNEQTNGKDLLRKQRIPLQVLSVPTMQPFVPHQVMDAHRVTSNEEPLVPSSPKSTEHSDTATMSVSLDTISDTSLVDCDEDSELKTSDSAFFSCTQSTAPIADSQDLRCEQEDELLLHKPKAVSRRSLVLLDQHNHAVNEYFPEILTYMRDAERRYRPRAGFMQKQPEISSAMRTKLVDWLIEVQEEYNLEDETVALAVAYSDRFLSSMSVTRPKLQLLGTTAMFVAAKYEEIYPPDADEFAYVTADTYSKAEVILMERLLLRVLGSTMAIPTAHQFLGLLLHNSTASSHFRSLCSYLTEITMLYDRFHYYPYSVLAAAAISVADYLTCASVDGAEIEVSGYKKDEGKRTGDRLNYLNFECKLSSIVQVHMKAFYDEIYACSLEVLLGHQHINSAPQQFIREKYSRKIHHKVALIPSPGSQTDSRRNDDGAANKINSEALLKIWSQK